MQGTLAMIKALKISDTKNNTNQCLQRPVSKYHFSCDVLVY